ncbi:MAG: Ion transport protein [Polaromonas sp.]|nr:Ion transport protein [Polaromonas sp.]
MAPSVKKRPPFVPLKPLGGWRLRWYRIIFEADTRSGRLFDQLLIGIILLSIAVVMADSVEAVSRLHGRTFAVAEWFFTALFTFEYLARLACIRNPWRYATSFFGVIDLLALLPTYLALFVPELHALIDVRVLRLLRVFRVFKLTEYVAEYQSLGSALAASRRKILVFLSTVVMLVLVLGTVMYVVEGRGNGFTSIPTSVYWAISTVTTVGFGDITPKTDLGRLIASFMMLLGWGTLAVPTGIVTAEMAAQRRTKMFQGLASRSCRECRAEGHAPYANFCFNCAARLAEDDRRWPADQPAAEATVRER